MNLELRIKKQFKKILHSEFCTLNSRGAVPFIIIIAGVIIILAVLVTVFRLNLFGSPKPTPSPSSSQVNATPNPTSRLAQLPSPTSPNSDQEEDSSDFDEEGDNIKAEDLDGDV